MVNHKHKVKVHISMVLMLCNLGMACVPVERGGLIILNSPLSNT